MRTLIVEDEGPARRRLEQLVQTHTKLKLVAVAKSGAEALLKIPAYQPELVLMDIQLKDKTAFDVLESLSPAINFQIIFITAYDHYAVKAFEIEAVDYLQKPFKQLRFESAIKRVLDKQTDNSKELITEILRQMNKEKTSVVIKEGRKDYIFQQNDILYIKSEGYHIRIFCQEESYLLRASLKSVALDLPSEFVRINKSVIVNTPFIVQMVHHKNFTSLILKNGEEFTSSNTYVKNLDRLLR